MTLEDFNNMQGHCPECGSDDIREERHDDENAGLDDVVLMHPIYSLLEGRSIKGFYVNCTCHKCGCFFTQRYQLRYAGQHVIKPGVTT